MSLKLTLWDHETQLMDILQAVADAADRGEEPTQETLAALEEYATQAMHRRDRMVRALREMERLEQALRAEADTLRRRATSVASTRERLEQYILSIMRSLDVQVLEGSAHVMRRRQNPPHVVITDPDIVPDEYKRSTIHVAFSLSGIARALRDGETVPGAELRQSERLDVR